MRYKDSKWCGRCHEERNRNDTRCGMCGCLLRTKCRDSKYKVESPRI